MTATVTLLRACPCGQPGAPLTVTCATDGEIARVYTCDACLAKTEARLASVRPVFSAMRDCAVPKPIADEVMDCLLELLDEAGEAPSCAHPVACRDVELRLRCAVLTLRMALRPYAAKHDPHAASDEHLYAWTIMRETEALP